MNDLIFKDPSSNNQTQTPFKSMADITRLFESELKNLLVDEPESQDNEEESCYSF